MYQDTRLLSGKSNADDNHIELLRLPHHVVANSER